MNPMQQVLTVLAILAVLPFAIKLLRWLRLLPLALYIVSTRLFFPDWAESNPQWCLLLLIFCVCFAIVGWGIRIIRHRRESRADVELLLQRYEEEMGLSPARRHLRYQHGVPVVEYDD